MSDSYRKLGKSNSPVNERKNLHLAP